MSKAGGCTRKHASTTTGTTNPQQKYQYARNSKRVDALMRVHSLPTNTEQLAAAPRHSPEDAIGCRWPRPAIGPCAAHLFAVLKDQLVRKYSRSRGAWGLILVDSRVIDPPLKTILQFGKQRRKHRRCAQAGRHRPRSPATSARAAAATGPLGGE